MLEVGGVFGRPVCEEFFVVGIELDVWVGDVLEDVVEFGFGDGKDFRLVVEDVPVGVDVQELVEADEGVAHECNTTALGRG